MKNASLFLRWALVLSVTLTATLIAAPSKGAGLKGHDPAAKTPGIAHRPGSHLDNQGGPDGFGYRYVDNQTGDTATYSWVELRGDPSATWLNFNSNPDDNVTSVPLSFEFPLYGQSFTSVNVSTNGNLQFTTFDAAFTNECLPADMISAPMICVFWDDLHLDLGGYNPGGDRTIAYRDFGDHVIIEWDSVGQLGAANASLKFEVILWADGRIKMQYNQLVNLDPQAQTIGIQSGQQTMLEYVCDDRGHQPVANLAIWFIPGATGAIHGVVRDNHNVPIALAAVRIVQTGAFTLTDSDGEYAFPMVAVGTYLLTASRTGYTTASIGNIQVLGGAVTDVDFTLTWLGIFTYTSNDVPRPINDLSTTVSTLQVDTPIVIGDLDVGLNITHTYDSDLWIALVSPQGDTVVLSDQNGGGGNNFTNTVFDDEAATAIANGTPPFTGSFRPDEPLSALDGLNAQGMWQLVVMDLAGGDTGELISWEIHVTPALAAREGSVVAEAFALYAAYPNPFNSSTTIRFAVPRSGPVTVTLYDLLGRNVRTLVSAPLAAGEHRVVWDGRDAAGIEAASGLYLIGLESGGSRAVGKLFLVR